MKKVEIIVYGIAIVVGIILLIIANLAHADYNRREELAKSLCSSINLTFGNYQHYGDRKIVCLIQQRTESEHLNISSQTLEIYLYPDWDYYLNKTTKR